MAIDPGYVAVTGFPGVLVVAGALGRQRDPDPFATGNVTQFVPNDPGNRDWIDYQAWVAAGNNAPMEPLANAKARKISEMRRRLEGYWHNSIVAQTFRWYTGVWSAQEMANTGWQQAADFLTGDGMAHLFDVNDVERVVTPAVAHKVAAAFFLWYAVAYTEYLAKVREVNECTTNAQVAAVTWTFQYTDANPFNADAYRPQGFGKGFDKGFS